MQYVRIFIVYFIILGLTVIILLKENNLILKTQEASSSDSSYPFQALDIIQTILTFYTAAVSYTHLDVYKRQRVEYPCYVDVFVCVVCFNEVVFKGGFGSGVECLCVFNVSLFGATSCLAYVEFVAI